RRGQRALDRAVQFVAQTAIVTLHLGKLGPVCRSILGQPAVDRIDAERKKLVELPLEGLQAKCAFSEQVPIKGFDVADVKNDAVPFRNRTVIHSFVANNAKHFVSTRTRFKYTGMDVVAYAGGAGKSSHGGRPFFGCAAREKDAPKTTAGSRLPYHG